MSLSPWNRVHLEKLTVTQLVMKLHVHNVPPLVPFLSHMNSVLNFPTCLFKIHSDIVLHAPGSFRYSLSFTFSDKNEICLILDNHSHPVIYHSILYTTHSSWSTVLLCAFLTCCGVSLTVGGSAPTPVVVCSRVSWAVGPQKPHRVRDLAGAGPNAWEPRDWGRYGGMLPETIWSRSARPSLRT